MPCEHCGAEIAALRSERDAALDDLRAADHAVDAAEAERDRYRRNWRQAMDFTGVEQRAYDEAVARAEAAEAERDERQRAIDQALSTLHRAAYVGGPSECEAWRTALCALGPFQTMEQGAPTAEEPSSSESSTSEEGQ